MKRINSSESLGVLVSMCPTLNDEGTSKNNNGYSKEFQAMLDSFEDEEEEETSLTMNSKKRRLSFHIVNALDKYFEVNKKLEPERKAKIAVELGLQPRQVAIWFQNRRARWKTKQLERDFGFLRSDYDDLRRSYEVLEHENQALSAELNELKSKLQDKNETKKHSPVKEEALFSESENNISEQSKISPGGFCGEYEPNVVEFKNRIEFKDGSSDSDSNEMFFDTDFQNPQQWIYQNQFGMVGEQSSIYGIAEEFCGLFDHGKNMHWNNLDN